MANQSNGKADSNSGSSPQPLSIQAVEKINVGDAFKGSVSRVELPQNLDTANMTPPPPPPPPPSDTPSSE